MENQHVLPFESVDDDVLAYRKATQARTQVLIASASDVRVAGQEVETLRNGIDEAVGNLNAAAFFGNVVPDIVEFRFCFRSNTMRR